MTKVISILNQKGGVGKTTLAVHMATALARSGSNVLLLDADPQGSALDWSAARSGKPLFPVVGLPKPSIHKELPSLAQNHEVILIDGPPRVYDVARSAIMAIHVICSAIWLIALAIVATAIALMMSGTTAQPLWVWRDRFSRFRHRPGSSRCWPGGSVLWSGWAGSFSAEK